MNNRIVLGILAHVDAGKTTLSEAILYITGTIRKIGRVDNKDTFLDTYTLERARGITVFSKQAEFELTDENRTNITNINENNNGRNKENNTAGDNLKNNDNMCITLLDTPGHVDFSAEMERTLQVLDYAILVISGADGVQGHTRTLWRLFSQYKIPVFIFVNKMDQKGTDKARILEELKNKLDSGCIDFTEGNIINNSEEFYDSVAICDEHLLDEFIENGSIEDKNIADAIKNRKIFPCFFGSALKLEGVEELLRGIKKYAICNDYPEEFGAKVYKITRNEQNERLTHVKITGGCLKTKDVIGEKVNQIRIYSGNKYKVVNEAYAGQICTLTGLNETYPGQGIGIEEESGMPLLEPVLTYKIELLDGTDAATALPKLRQLEEEEPELHIVWDERLQEIQAQVMGEVQIEILKSIIKDRFNIEVEFGQGNIVYRETISNVVEGIGHFEPLKHYAEVHLLMEPGERGSGITIAADCSEDMLDRNWQRLIITHIHEKEHKGVLIGASITDIKITLVAGRAHLKHTEGGDFRQATYRAVRQGLKKAQSVLLEPYYNYRLEIPTANVGRAMTDIERMSGTFELEQQEDMAVIKGSVPVINIRDYQREVNSYTKGLGKLFCTFKGYEPCHNADEVISASGYDPDSDLNEPAGSVFCSHGAGFNVSWDRVEEYMHIESYFARIKKNDESNADISVNRKMSSAESARTVSDEWIGTDEVDAILRQTYGANKKDKDGTGKWSKKSAGKRVFDYSQSTSQSLESYKKTNKENNKKYLLVDGYNVIFAWNELNELAAVNIDGARGRLLDIMCNYQPLSGSEIIVVFDAYRVKGHDTEYLDYNNIHVVYTKEAETADQYIEKFAHENGRKYNVTVATSDGLEQIIIRGQGCALISSREFEKEVLRAENQLRTDYIDNQPKNKNLIMHTEAGKTLSELNIE